jgi:hypothetical protein
MVVGQNEGFNLNIFTEPGAMANQATSVQLRVFRRDNNQTVFDPLAPVATPFSINLPPSTAVQGTLVLIINANGHFRMDKTPNPSPQPAGDRGIYCDTCPPAPEPQPGQARTIGYWKNHESATSQLLPQRLGAFLVSTFSDADEILREAHSKNAHDMLAAQLLAAKLNIASGIPHSCVDASVNQADSILINANYAGPGTTVAPTGSSKDSVNAVKDILDSYNNNGCP